MGADQSSDQKWEDTSSKLEAWSNPLNKQEPAWEYQTVP